MTPGVLGARNDPMIAGRYSSGTFNPDRGKTRLAGSANKIYQLCASWICRANRGPIRARKRRPNRGVEATNVGRLCGDYEKQSLLRSDRGRDRRGWAAGRDKCLRED